MADSCCRQPYISEIAVQPGPEVRESAPGMRWYAAFIRPQNEKAAARHLQVRNIISFLPTYEVVRRWKNRQRVRLSLPLFPCYLFVQTGAGDWGRVLSCPGVLNLVGNARGPIPVADEIIEFLRSDCGPAATAPFSEPVAGRRVRIRAGMLKGLEGVLVRQKSELRFVLTIDPIQLHATIEVDLEDLEPM